ncbi:MAG: hypothetical protein AB1349_14460, partial [Elusimicrobiota bacterium]
MNKKILPILIVIGFLIWSGEVIAENIVLGSYANFPEKVRIIHKPDGASPNRVPESVVFTDYIKGVVYGEIRNIDDSYGLSSAQKVNVYKAQALAAETYFASRIVGKNPYGTYTDPDTNETYPIVYDSEAFQVYLPYDGSISEIGQAVDSSDVTNKAIYFSGSIFDTLYFNQTTNGFTKNSEDASSNGYWYNEPLRKQISPCGNPSDTAGQCGMSQIGAILLAGSTCGSRDYETILKHYYGAMPPYVKKVVITQEGQTCYTAELIDDNNKPSPTRHLIPGDSLESRNLKPLNANSNATITIEFSEYVVSPGAGIQIEIDNTTITGGSRNRAGQHSPPETWTFTLTPSQITSLGDGQKTLKITAYNLSAQSLELDSTPKT